MNKEELIELLQSLEIPVNEGESSVSNSTKYPRVVFWDYVWQDQVASDDTYVTVETYQVSFFSKTPRHEKLLELRNKLRERGLRPQFFHEFIEDKEKNQKYYHSYFNLEILVDTDE